MDMDYKRIFLYVSIFLVSLLLWNAWQKDYPIEKTVTQTVAQNNSTTATTNSAFIPPTTTATVTGDKSQQQTSAVETTPTSRQIQIKTDVLQITLDKLGGDLIESDLLKFPIEKNSKTPITLFSQEQGKIYLAQNGIATAEQTQRILFQANQDHYELTPGEKTLTVKLTGKLPSGIEVEKDYVFTAGTYLIEVNYRLANPASKTWQGQLYHQIVRQKPEGEKSGLFHMTSYTGASISDPKEKLYENVSFSHMQEQALSRNVTGGWIAMQQHYFVSAWVPPSDQQSRFYSNAAPNNLFTIGLMGPPIELKAGQSYTTQMKLFVGPEITSILKPIAPGLNLTVDYGFLWFISVIVFWLMKQIYNVVGNWGWAIILVTVFIKLAFYKLSATSYRSMANLKKLQPKMEAIKQRFADDKQKLSQATMELYKKEKINPLGGCLPILVQLPVFIALYWVLLESVELRQAPFIFWIQDLSIADPYYILPIIMGVSMFIQQKRNPPPPDPTQAKVMMLLPVLFTFIFLHFPAGLVLYWVVNNVLSIAQQWYITQKIEPSKKVKPAQS